MNEQRFIEELKMLGIDVTPTQLDQFNQYYDLLVEWNEKINLTTIIKEEEVYLKHFYDSATIAKIINLNNEANLCDVGSGAGFPGVVLKILYPSLKVTLVDSLNKRILFLNEVISKLKLTNIIALHDRAEEYSLKNREIYDVVTVRAVAPLSVLLEYCIPLLKVGKYFIPMKSTISQEILDAKNALKVLDSSIESELNFLLPNEGSNRTLLLIKKNNKTKMMYPRKNSEIKKNSL